MKQQYKLTNSIISKHIANMIISNKNVLIIMPVTLMVIVLTFIYHNVLLYVALIIFVILLDSLSRSLGEEIGESKVIVLYTIERLEWSDDMMEIYKELDITKYNDLLTSLMLIEEESSKRMKDE